MKLRNLAIGIVILLVVVVAAGIVVIKSIDLNQYRDLVAEKAKQATGRELRLQGDVEFSISLNPVLSINQASFANASWGSRPEMVRLQRFEVEVALMPLLSGKIQVNRVVLRGVDVLLETNAEGTGNWQLQLPPREASGGALPEVNEVQIIDLKLAYRDGNTGKVNKLALDKVIVRSSSLASPLQFELSGSLNGNAIQVKGEAGPLNAIVQGSAYPVTLDARIADATVRVMGQMPPAASDQARTFKVSAHGASLASLSGLAGSSLPKVGPWSLSADINDGKHQLKLANIKLALGQTSLNGDLRLDKGTQPGRWRPR